ncbi:RNA polymerase sigma-70 factor, ECF subfamily [Chitinophaga ginsengisegetis]|uniref:RNA polymerase sigma-70 factor, ECF subfamily n=1 Tax=Chitinophaga ginsengisegetis TaxID=393003 RepID=A0A1T5P862_9BACT|nr:RNA polymerase sigma-70 factor [Chitinophaga ginsengisegetis]MDR6567951.1 RNA polymerase sigma-70 factor (ECF subfamily) [Chitinophaga ginsengisegetis]MDR6647494.1 RNA polymerase sigma-70 factor (ECF subfamily) [Chitinophaga ginsengisegetis]MDR6653844.1 RNA polymerase sigma-70 factor (ECF subfamily) [Chitinophaga ginsengisegetis]SKD08901.1 RNA polymerase sigma-70 factor, ECF subfamily [Chitinophaga ginsengisegetis]
MHAQLYNDKELFQLISEGDETAFRMLFRRYVPELRPLILHLTKTGSVTDDIVQETFLRLWISRDKLPEIENPRSWLLRIVFHLSFSYLRKQVVHHKAIDAITSDYTADAPASSTEETMVYNAMMKQVSEAVAQLPPQAKRIYLLSREKGLKIPEIAGELSISPNTVKNSLVRSLQFIRKQLELSGHLFPAVVVWLLTR